MTKLTHLILILVTVMTPLLLRAQNVSDVRARQLGNRIEISYTLDKEANTTIVALINGKTYSCNSVSGDIGSNMRAGRHVVYWDVLSDMDKLVGDVSFQVRATMSSNDLRDYTNKQNKLQARQARKEGIYPFAGIDVNAGIVGAGASIYWPWVTGRPSRVGSYLSYVYGLTDWKDTEDSGSFHNICLGMTVTLGKHVAWFLAPGLSIVNEDGKLNLSEYRYDTFSSFTSMGDDYYSGFDREYDDTDYTRLQYKFAAETGIGIRFLSCLMASVKVSYPLYVGLGLGLEFGGR